MIRHNRGRRGLGHRAKTVPKDRPPLCVARLLEGAKAGRVGCITALPPSLDLEIQAIRQVGSASMKTLHVSLCRPSLWPKQYLVVTCPSPGGSALAPALKTLRPWSLTSSIFSVPVPYLSTYHRCVPVPHPCPPSPLSCLGPSFSLPSQVHIHLLLPGGGCSQFWPL